MQLRRTERRGRKRADAEHGSANKWARNAMQFRRTGAVGSLRYITAELLEAAQGRMRFATAAITERSVANAQQLADRRLSELVR